MVLGKATMEKYDLITEKEVRVDHHSFYFEHKICTKRNFLKGSKLQFVKPETMT